MKRHIIIDDEQEKLLSSICDLSLKSNGMQVFNLVQKLLASVRDFSDES